MTTRLRTFARRMRHFSTDAELRLWRELRGRRFSGWKFRRQQPLGPYVVDFVCFDTRLVLELDGSQHVEQVGYDTMRTGWLNAQGFRVLRFWNHDVLENTSLVLDAIHGALQGP